MTPRQLLGRALTALRRPASDTAPLPVVDKYGRRIITGDMAKRGQILLDTDGKLWFVVREEGMHFALRLVDGDGWLRYVNSGEMFIIEEEAP